MKTLFRTIVILMIATSTVAQELPDTLDTINNLQEVVIEAPRVVHKADMDLYYPSHSAVDNSKNGLQLLNNLMIPTLSVAEALGTIQAAGQSVQLRINGRESSIAQVRALLPETIKRVEWIDNPGLRYKGANYVLNFIVTNPTVGGSVMANVQPSVNQAWGFYMADAKFNSGYSQFEVGGNLKLTNNLKSHRDYFETFTFPDGSSLMRNETSSCGRMDNTFGRFWASYNYIKSDTTIFMVDLFSYNNFKDKIRYDGRLSMGNDAEDIILTDIKGGPGTTPTLSMYWEQHFAHKQMLVVDFNSSFYFGKAYSDYIEQVPSSLEYLTDIHTMIKDRNQAYAAEVDYIKHWKRSRLTAGTSYTANRNRSKYENLDGRIFHQKQDKVYFFAEYFHRLNKVTLTAGLGAQYTNIFFKESKQGSTSWNMRPQASVTYGISQDHRLRLSFDSWQSTPTLAQTNVVPQQLDGFQWRVGNPDLKTSNSYMLTLRYNFNMWRMSGTFGIRAFTSPNAITPILYWEDSKLITSYENSKGLRNLSFFLAPQIEIIPKWVTFSGYLQYRMERMRGTGYKLHNYNWSGNANLQITHWGFVLSGQYVRAQHDLYGEQISWGENLSLIELSYNHKSWQFGAGCIMPFGKYDQGSKMLSKWNTNEQHMRINMRIPYIKISYNLQWGRQKRGAQKRIKADANVDTSTAGGR